MTHTPRPGQTVHHNRDHNWTGTVIQTVRGMTEVAWNTGTLAGERKWTGTENLTVTR